MDCQSWFPNRSGKPRFVQQRFHAHAARCTFPLPLRFGGRITSHKLKRPNQSHHCAHSGNDQ